MMRRGIGPDKIKAIVVGESSEYPPKDVVRALIENGVKEVNGKSVEELVIPYGQFMEEYGYKPT